MKSSVGVPCSPEGRFAVLHVGPVAEGRISGVTNAVVGLVRAQNAVPGVSARLISSTQFQPGQIEGTEFSGWKEVGHFLGDWDLSPRSRPDIVVFHSTYIPRHAGFASLLRARKIPYIVVPHGGLTRNALSQKATKKRIGNILFFDRYVRGSVGLQFLTEREGQESRALGLPSFVCPNGCDLPPEDAAANPGRRSGLRVLFLGRLAIQSKGLDLLLDACALASSALREMNVKVRIVGPDAAGSRKWLAKRIRELSLGDFVELGDPVIGQEKMREYRESDLFVHASRSEGHPVAVLEAMAHGLPCVLTRGTNLDGVVERAGAGWAAGHGAVGVAKALVGALSNRRDLQERGKIARQLVEERYSWSSVAKSAIEGYLMLLR